MFRNLQCLCNSQGRKFSDNLRYKCISTKTVQDVSAHNSLPTFVNPLGLLKKKERRKKDDEQFCMGGKMLFWISGASQRISTVLKVCTIADTTLKTPIQSN